MRLSFLTALLLITVANAQQATVQFYAPELFPPGISGAVCGFSADGKTIYFVREDTVTGKLFIYNADKKGKKWINEKLISFSGQHNDMGGRLSSDGLNFYFTSDRPGGSDKAEDLWNIWVSHFNNGIWDEPQPLSIINNKGNECCPVPVAEDKIIFSSDRGVQQQWWMFAWDGENDTAVNELTEPKAWQWPSFYVASEKLILLNSMKRKDSTGKDDVYISFYRNDKWTMPINIGAPVNTLVYEDGAIVTQYEKYLIFNRHETGATPSRVMYTKWKPVLKHVKKEIASSLQ